MAKRVESTESGLERIDASKLVPVTAADVARRRSRFWFAGLGAFLVVAVCAGWLYKRSSDQLRAQDSFDSGQRLFAATKYDQAILSFDRAVALKPDFADAFMLRARCRLMSYDTAGAVPDFSRVIELRPHDTAALLARGEAYLLLRNYGGAIADATAVLAVDPKLPDAYNLRGRAAREAGNPQSAMEDFNKAVELKPSGDNYYQRGATEQSLGQHDKAIADFGESIEFNPDMAEGYFARAESERAIGQMESAQKDHAQARLIDGR